MQTLVILFFLAQTVLCRVAYNLESDRSNEELSLEAIKEIQQLIEFTKKVDESQEPVPKLLQGPLRVSERDVHLYVYNRNDQNGKKIALSEIGEIKLLTAFDTNLDTVFVIHGWLNTFNSTFNNVVNAALLEIRDVNVISVDWDNFSRFSYFTAYLAVSSVGNFVGKSIRNISEAYNYPLERFSLIGHSLGAHICGFAGRYVDGLVSSITGLDPAGPLYYKALPNNRLNVNDAQYVEVIHTDAMFLGTNFHIGDIDYWPNGGLSQPGCDPSFGSCSHGRSFYYFGESLVSGSNNFVSTECKSFKAYEAGLCQNNTIAFMGGITYNETLTGDFYLITNKTSPYGLGYVNLPIDT
ncbi:unnamed protein product [Ceutorhynchus assimilis]|uniref:Lipase domain-containing protein n=1 Tax=Ceutorhynchus assimilis TaxID=467358 RepID=A0A9N9M872_9CUCU|nr:unnamed protein product [Ceutorhynchus assimilis]